MINIKFFFPDQIEIDQKYYNDITTCYIGYFTIKNTGNINIHSVSLLYLIFNEVDGYIRKMKGNEYLVFASTDKYKEVLTKHTKL